MHRVPTSLTLVTAPTFPIVTLAEAKGHLHVDTSDDDARITLLIEAATSAIDGAGGVLGAAFARQTWRMDAPGFPDKMGTISPYHGDHQMFPGSWRLPLPPTSTTVFITYVDTAGADQSLAAETFRLGPGGQRGTLITLSDGYAWPDTLDGIPNAARVTFGAGYATADEIPTAIKAAILLYVEAMYDTPGLVDMPEIVGTLIAPFRRGHVG